MHAGICFDFQIGLTLKELSMEIGVVKQWELHRRMAGHGEMMAIQ